MTQRIWLLSPLFVRIVISWPVLRITPLLVIVTASLTPMPFQNDSAFTLPRTVFVAAPYADGLNDVFGPVTPDGICAGRARAAHLDCSRNRRCRPCPGKQIFIHIPHGDHQSRICSAAGIDFLLSANHQNLGTVGQMQEPNTQNRQNNADPHDRDQNPSSSTVSAWRRMCNCL